MPQIWPVLVGATCLAFALSFDEFIITFFVIGPDSHAAACSSGRSLRRTVDPSINVVSTLLMAVTLAALARRVPVRRCAAAPAARPRAADALAAEVVPL